MGSNTNKKWLRKRNNENKSSDELHYEELREFASESLNRYCFDCNQRGPTYVNMTIGSLVCMRCSGLLRGLTPPHRVKSMSMATYSMEEMEFIKERGNDYCKQVWLSLYEGTGLSDSADEQEIKDFMIQKYERKRYYVDPKTSGVKFRSEMLNTSRSSTQSELKSPSDARSTTSSDDGFVSSDSLFEKCPSTKVLKQQNNKVSSLDNTVKILRNTSIPRSTPSNTTTHDEFVADFSKADIFVADQANCNNSFNNQPSFANFENNPIFNSSTVKSTVQSKLSSQLATPPPSEDRYAALKDLDNALKQEQQFDWGSAGHSPHNGSMFSVSPQSSFGSPLMDNPLNKEPTVWNPFSANHFGTANNQWGQPTESTLQNAGASMFNANPFRAVNGVNGFNGNMNGGGYPTHNSAYRPTVVQQQSMFASQPIQMNNFDTVNPFKLGISPGATNGAFSSNNPFL